jgi:transcriptional regulator with XRE-family HTH domain
VPKEELAQERNVALALVGERLRDHREEAGVGIRALAREVGLSASFISQVELGRTKPSLNALYLIVSRLGISFDELFADRASGASSREVGSGSSLDDIQECNARQWKAPSDGPVLRSDKRLILTLDSGVRWERLTASNYSGIEFLYCTYPIGGESCPAEDLMTHAGFECGITLEGRLGATVGEASYELGPGDSIAFASPTPHRIWAIGTEPAVAIWTVIGRAGDSRMP